MKKCVYCGKIIKKNSREHVIQNALGGLYESEDICCGKCNNYVSKFIDNPFNEIFNPIISRIDNFAKTNNKKSSPSYTGKALYEDGKVYEVTLKNGRIVDCISLKKVLRRNLSKYEYSKFTILSYDFVIGNREFKNGISKIAFNFALENGVEIELLKEFLIVEKKDDIIKKIEFHNAIVPFYAFNPFDEYIELRTNMELYHNLILFNQKNLLWCYVDLFNTFQYYVLLSKKWDEKKPITKSYLQLLQKMDRNIPDINVRKVKDILTYAMYYNVEPCMDLELLKKRIATVVQKESLKKNMTDVISAKLGWNYLGDNKIKEMSIAETAFYLSSLLLYMDEDDCLKEETFRQVTGINENKQQYYSYPLLINELLTKGEIDIQLYTYKKFERLNRFLVEIDNIDQGKIKEI